MSEQSTAEAARQYRRHHWFRVLREGMAPGGEVFVVAVEGYPRRSFHGNSRC